MELLRDPNAAGRDHILFSTDEVLLDELNYLHAPTHVLAVRTLRRSSSPTPTGSRARRARYLNRRSSSSTTTPRRKAGPRPEATRTIRAPRLWRTSCSTNMPQQMEAPLPPSLKETAAEARASYIAYVAKSNVTPLIEALHDLLGYGDGPF